jgi:hypothetical protein
MDIIASLAASIALTWPASALIALGERMTFRRRRREPVVESVALAPLAEPRATIEAKPMPERIQIKPKASRNRRQKQKALPSPADLEVAKFGKDRVVLDQRAAAAMSDINAAYEEWAHEQGLTPRDQSEMDGAFKRVFARANVDVAGGKAWGLRLKGVQA